MAYNKYLDSRKNRGMKCIMLKTWGGVNKGEIVYYDTHLIDKNIHRLFGINDYCWVDESYFKMTGEKNLQRLRDLTGERYVQEKNGYKLDYSDYQNFYNYQQSVKWAIKELVREKWKTVYELKSYEQGVEFINNPEAFKNFIQVSKSPFEKTLKTIYNFLVTLLLPTKTN